LEISLENDFLCNKDFLVLQVSAATLFRWGRKCLH